MAAPKSELEELRSRLDWFDEERRKTNRKLTELEQKQTLEQQETAKRERRIRDLEQQLATATAQLGRFSQIDTQIAQFKEETIRLMEQYDQRRIQSEKETDRMRRVEQEGAAREIADVRKELPAISRLQQSMDLRIAEEARLASLIGTHQNKLAGLSNQIESWERAITFVEEKENRNTRAISEIQAAQSEVNKKWNPIDARIDNLASGVLRVEATHREIKDAQNAIRESTQGWMEQIQIGEYSRNQKLEVWRETIEENQDIIASFKQEWIKFNDQYKESKMAVQTMLGWQQQIEAQQKESSETLRVESHRMQSYWDAYQVEIEKRLRTFTTDVEQRWSHYDRNEKQAQEQFLAVDEKLAKFADEKGTLERIQTAQADAIKRWGRIWMEEVEKAIENNPNRRRQPALVSVRDDTL